MTSTERPAIILDCDPGHDDAIAIVIAARNAELVGITTVSGNAPIESTTHNALVMKDLLGLDVPVHKGATRPLVAPPQYATFVHGESGLDGADLPEPTSTIDGDNAAEWIIETCRAREGLWLVPVGPLTNIGMALRLAPDLARRIAGISIMGGGTFGNRTTAGEFNIWVDPEAADIVFSYGGPLIMAGLNLTHQFRATQARIDQVKSMPGLLANVLGDLLQFFTNTYMRRHHGMDGGAIHDPCAVMALTHPHLFTKSRRHVVIELTGTHTRGMTLVDQRDLREVKEANCDVLETIDAEAAFAVMTDAIAHFSK
ncbi:MAG: nucleoside hydrolase [Ilumatobacteraceae bacterium]